MRPIYPASLVSLTALILAACTTPEPPRGSSRGPSAHGRQSAPPPRTTPRWQPAPVRADGIAVQGGRRHTVKRGETGIAIARAYGVSWSRIAAANKIDREATIHVGQHLFIPTGQSASASSRPTNPQTRPAPKPVLGPNATPEQHAAAFQLDIDDLITGSAPATASKPPASRPAPRPSTAATPKTPAPRPATSTATTSIPSLAWPVDGRVILSRYGPKPAGRVNDGINIKAVRGSPVRAAAAGEVIYVGDAIAGYGLMMLVRHSGGIVTAYAHLEDALADRGDKVQKGQTIGRVGSSGSVSEPQLHFQLRQGRRTLDPSQHLPR